MSHRARVSESLNHGKSLENRVLAESFPDAVCIGCGCTPFQACRGSDGTPCRWVAIDEQSGIGLCSSCAVLPIDILLEKADQVERSRIALARINL
jgi:hypothetical protein